MNYYLKLRDRAYGPFTLEKLRSMIQRGNVDAASQISTDKKTWREAESFPELFGAAQAPAQPAAYQGAPAQPAAYQGDPAQPAAYQGAPASPNANDSAVWFLSLDGQTGSGPYTAAVLHEAVRSGQANADSLVWRNGENARTMRDDPEFAHLFAASYANGANAQYYNAQPNQNFASIAESLSKRFRSYWISTLLFFLLPLLGGVTFAIVGLACEGDSDVLGLMFAAVILPCVYIAPLVCGTLSFVFFLMFIHAFWRALPQRYARTTPGAACGLLLIPFFALYWNFVVFCQGTASANRALQDVTPNGAPRAQISETLAFLYAITAIVIPFVALFLSFPLLNQMRQVGSELCAVASTEQTRAF